MRFVEIVPTKIIRIIMHKAKKKSGRSGFRSHALSSTNGALFHYTTAVHKVQFDNKSVQNQDTTSITKETFYCKIMTQLIHGLSVHIRLHQASDDIVRFAQILASVSQMKNTVAFHRVLGVIEKVNLWALRFCADLQKNNKNKTNMKI